MPDILDLHAQAQPGQGRADLQANSAGRTPSTTPRQRVRARDPSPRHRAGDSARSGSGRTTRRSCCGDTRRARPSLVSVPLSYRFTPDEMPYVINDSDAALVFCDPSYRTTLEALDAAEGPRDRRLRPGRGAHRVEPHRADRGDRRRPDDRRVDDLHVRDDREAEGRGAWRDRPRARRRDDRRAPLHTGRRPHHDRPAVPLGPGRVLRTDARRSAARSSSSSASTPRSGCDSSTSTRSTRRSPHRRS